MIRLFGREFNVTINRKVKILLAVSCFIFGLVIFFPIESLESRVNDSLSRTLRMDVRVSNPRLGLGLRAGIVSGGLFGLKAERLEITPFGASQPFQCVQPVISPKILALLILRVQIAVRCDIGESNAPLGIVFRAPLYNMNASSAELILDEISAADLARFVSIRGLSGIVSGNIHAESFLQDPRAMKVSWNISGEQIQTPAVVSDFAQLPALSFESVESEGSYMRTRLKVDNLVLGSASKGPFFADLKIDFGLNSQGMPVSGSVSGKQKSDPAFEQNELSSINLDLLFGKVKPSGMREFKKEVQGSPMSLLMPAAE